MTKGKFILLTVAVAIGASLNLFREYMETDLVTGRSVIISIISFVIGFVIVCLVGWWANRLVVEEKDE